LGSALDQENRELAEQIRIDQTYIGEQSGDFKLPDAAREYGHDRDASLFFAATSRRRALVV
jgi:hypothetical protein